MSTANPANFPIESVRNQFPALAHAGNFVFFDNAAGAQVPRQVLEAIQHHLIDHNVQRGGRYAKSVEVDAGIERARMSVAALLNARNPNEVAFGMNATTFIRLVSLAIAQDLSARNEIVVTELDHEANIATWCALEKLGARIVWWHARADGSLVLDDLRPLLSERTRLVACTLASNALGTVVDVAGISRLAHAAGAEVFVDSVHYAPHGAIDVQAMDCDYLVCSGYKIFGPHMGFLWGRYESLQRLQTFREDFIPDEPPGKIEAGTFIFENVAGMDAAIAYLAQLGRAIDGRAGAPDSVSLRSDLVSAWRAIGRYEQTLSREMLRVLSECGAVVHGIADALRVDRRVPTFSFTVPGVAPRDVTDAAIRADIGIRDGHLYAPRLLRRLSVPLETGVVRASLVHYNTHAEIHRLGEVLWGLTQAR